MTRISFSPAYQHDKLGSYLWWFYNRMAKSNPKLNHISHSSSRNSNLTATWCRRFRKVNTVLYRKRLSSSVQRDWWVSAQVDDDHLRSSLMFTDVWVQSFLFFKVILLPLSLVTRRFLWKTVRETKIYRIECVNGTIGTCHSTNRGLNDCCIPLKGDAACGSILTVPAAPNWNKLLLILQF